MERPMITLDTITIDCLERDVPELMDFYEKLTGFKPDTVDGVTYPTLLGPSIAISFFPVNNYNKPTFPSPAIGRQIHIDFYVDDLPSAIRYARMLGAKDSPKQFHDSYQIMFDPVGHPFCLTTNGPTLALARD